MVNGPSVVCWCADPQNMLEMRSMLSGEYLVEATLDADLSLAYVQKLDASVLIADMDLTINSKCQIKTVEWLRKKLGPSVKMIIICGAKTSADDYAALHMMADILLERPYPPFAVVDAITALVSLASRTKTSELITV